MFGFWQVHVVGKQLTILFVEATELGQSHIRLGRHGIASLKKFVYVVQYQIVFEYGDHVSRLVIDQVIDNLAVGEGLSLLLGSSLQICIDHFIQLRGRKLRKSGRTLVTYLVGGA